MSTFRSDDKKLQIGQRLFALRQKLEISQSEFASQLGITSRSVQNYERSERQPPTDVIQKIYLKFLVDPSWLLNGQELTPRFSDPIKDDILLQDIIFCIETYVSENNIDFNPKKKSQLIRLLFKEFRNSYEIDEHRVQDLIKLAS